MDTKNLKFWNSVKDTPEEFTTKLDSGLTSINPQWQKQRATKEWGMYGDKWGLKDLKWGTIYNNNALVLHTLTATLVYPNGEFEISVDSLAYDKNANLITDFRKSMQTDAIGKALSYLGFSADIYMSGVEVKTAEKEKVGGVKGKYKMINLKENRNHILSLLNSGDTGKQILESMEKKFIVDKNVRTIVQDLTIENIDTLIPNKK